METSDKRYVLLDNLDLPFAVHPGKILGEELKARKIKNKDCATAIGMKPPHLSAIIHGTRNITSEIAVKLEKALGISASSWMNLQNIYNIDRIKLASGVYSTAPVLAEPEEEFGVENKPSAKDIYALGYTAGCQDTKDTIKSALISAGVQQSIIDKVIN